MPKPHDTQNWSIEGRFQHLIYSPKGAIEGLLIETDGTPTQFVTDPQDASNLDRLGGLTVGQTLVVEGSEEGPSPKGESSHFVYRFHRLASVDGVDAGPPQEPAQAHGKIVRFNYAKHGEPNGFVLDSGDFVHTRPDGFAALRLAIGDEVRAEGPSRPLVDGRGRVVEAHRVNDRAVGPA
jgi:hypothetical protein